MDERAALFLGFCLLWSLPSSGQVKMRIRPDGSKLLYNEPSVTSTPRATTTVSRDELRRLITHHADRQRLDPALVDALIQVESGYDAHARSRRGAMGLMQLMPETARRLGVRDAYDPEENIRGGTAYLRQMIDRFNGSLQMALAGYNAGPSAVEEHGGIPPYRETTGYVKKVLTLYRGDAGDIRPARAKRRVRSVQIQRDRNNRIILTTGGG